jgi:GT2 family glycosyltransferase
MAAEALLQEYLATLSQESEEVRFLERVPWIVGTHRQEHVHILEGLRAEASRFAELEEGPFFSLLTPLWNTPPRLLEELILSVRCQSWLRWELILVDDGSHRKDHLEVARRWAERDPRIRFSARAVNGGISRARNQAVELASGDFLAILDHDDLLHPLALSAFVRHLWGRPDVNLLYSNEAKINETSDCVSFYLHKPPFDLTTLLRVNYLCHFTAIRRDLVLSSAREGLVFRPQFDGAEDHDLFLRIAFTGRVRPLHVPMCLYYWRMIATSSAQSADSKPATELRRNRMLEEHLSALYPGARWRLEGPSSELGGQYPSIRLTTLPQHPRPKLLVMVPFRDQVELTHRCLAALEAQQHDLDVRVLLINNQSRDPATMFELDQWLSRPRRNRFAVIDHDGAFNYARMHNHVVDVHGGDHDLLLFLNNDVALLSPDCLQTLALHVLAEKECAFAGIRLSFPEGGGVQHGGIKIDNSALTCGCYPFVHATEITDYVAEERVVFAVTFACAMVRREVYERLGGLDEVLFPNSYGDVDIQARALAMGWRNFYFGTLVGTHHESKTRRRASEECEFLALHSRHADVISHWKLRGFTLSLQDWPALPEPAPLPTVEAQASTAPPLTAVPPLPLRYKLADRVNQALKRFLGPAHAVLKGGILHGRRWVRQPGVANLAAPPKGLKRHPHRLSVRVRPGRRR